MTNSLRQPGWHICSQWLLVRGIALVFLIAFGSLYVQLGGLIGSQGILPAASFLQRVAEVIPGAGRYWQFPTLFWLNASDASLFAVCLIGALASSLALLSIAEGPSLLMAWICWLSLVTVGQDFLSFQWDVLLLEAGFLAIFLCPWQLVAPPWRLQPLLEPERRTAALVIWLFRWLLFRLMLLSGLVKLISGDPSWRSLSALKFHYETQPLPTPLAWWANQLPAWFQTASVAGVFFIELLVPFLMLAPRRLRLVAACFTVLLQVLIAITGNYTFFNLLTVILCISLLDDAVAARLIPQRLRCRIVPEATSERHFTAGLLKQNVRRVAVLVVSSVVAVVSASQLAETFLGSDALVSPAEAALQLVQPLHIVNTYGLFAVMTTTRPEITIEGSDDLLTWKAYVFPFKPGPLDRAPPLVAPYQPRLDWQMWFAALGPASQSPWFYRFTLRLLQGSRPVLSLLSVNPFSDRPPRYIRATLSQYKFTDFAERAHNGNWWKATPDGLFFGPVSMDDFRL